MIVADRSPLEFMADLVDSPEPPCGWPLCAQGGAWQHVCRSCNAVRQVCDSHRRATDALLGLNSEPVACDPDGVTCQALHPVPIPWRPI